MLEMAYVLFIERRILTPPGFDFLQICAFKAWDFHGPGYDDSYCVYTSGALAILYLCHGACRWWSGFSVADFVELGVTPRTRLDPVSSHGFLSVSAVVGPRGGVAMCGYSL